MSYYITTDATCDFMPSFKAEKHAIIPMSYSINGTEYGIDKFLDSKEFFEMVSNGAMPTTSLITVYFAKEILSPILREGNDILHLCFSSGLSGSFNNLVIAVKELQEEFPDRTIKLIDSKCACMGEAIINNIAIANRKKGMSLDDNYSNLLEMSSKICHYFTVNDLYHLQRGGRVSKVAAVFGTMLNIKPILYCNSDGKLVPIDKVRSRKKALLALVDYFNEKRTENTNDFPIYICHSDCVEDAEFLKEKLIEKGGATNVEINFVGPVIGSHTGKGCVVLMFVGKDRHEAQHASHAE